MIRYRRMIIIASCLSLFFITGLVSAETIRLTNGEAPPYLSESLPHYGYFSHIVTETFALEGITVEYGFFPWKRAFDYVEKGKWDGSISWIKHPEREKVVIFSETAIGKTREVFLYRKGYAFDWQTFADLKGHRVGALRGFAHVKIFESVRQAGTQFTIDTVSSEVQNLKKLLANRIDVFPCFDIICQQYLRKQFSPKEQASIVAHPLPLNENPQYLIISKQSKQAEYWLRAFKLGMNKLKASGRYNQMREDFLNGVYDKKE